MIRCAWLRAVAVVGMLLPASVPAQQANPLEGDAAAVGAGRELYAARCADCHGADALGKAGPDLTAIWAAGATDERVFATIRHGVAGSIMPPSTASDAEIWAVVAYLRSIGTAPPLHTDGDAAEGDALFAAHCSTCHRVAGVGGALGPDLTHITRLRSRESLVLSVRMPSAVVGQGYRAVTIQPADGPAIRAVVKREDAFSLQVVSEDGRLRGFDVAELDEVTRASASLMPPFGVERLSDADLEHILAYLVRAAAEDTSR